MSHLLARNIASEKAVVSGFFSDPPCRYYWADPVRFGKSANPLKRRILAKVCGIPILARNQGLGCPSVGISLKGINVVLIQIVKESHAFFAVEMQGDMGQFMTEGEPEIVEPIMT